MPFRHWPTPCNVPAFALLKTVDCCGYGDPPRLEPGALIRNVRSGKLRWTGAYSAYVEYSTDMGRHWHGAELVEPPETGGSVPY